MGSMMSKLLFLGALVPRALAFTGNDFSNNLFSDLAPLLALFGEQVAKQFMSQSMSWLEDIIFAMAPLGIITAIISAIRVSGTNEFKAVVGRARESSAAAEVELMSSTSHEVCELWNGHAIVRVMGSPSIAEILYFENEASENNFTCGLYTFEEALKRGLLKNLKLRPTRDQEGRADEGEATNEEANGRSSGVDIEMFPVPQPRRGITSTSSLDSPNATSAPNISINFCEIHNKQELWIFAILGTILQFGSLLFIGLIRYKLRLEDKTPTAHYAYPLMATGTILLVLGMLICSHVVQAASQEVTWGVAPNGLFRVLWLQKYAVVNDQVFESFAIFAEELRAKLITSRRRIINTSKKSKSRLGQWILSYQGLTIVGSLVSLTGFVIQFVGLRGLHWSASIAQLVVVLLMTAARTWIRRNMSARPAAKRLPEGCEIDWLAIQLGTYAARLWEVAHHRRFGPSSGDGSGDGGEGPVWEVLPQTHYPSYSEAREASQNMQAAWMVVRNRERLGWLTKWPGKSHRTASNLSTCIQRILDFITTTNSISLISSTLDVVRWILPVRVSGDPPNQYTVFTARRRDNEDRNWRVPTSELEAVISLWMFAIQQKEQRDIAADQEGNPPDHTRWLQELVANKGNSRVVRVLGKATTEFLDNWKWWVDRGGRFVTVRPADDSRTTFTIQELPRTTVRANDAVNQSTAESLIVSNTQYCFVGPEVDGDGSLALLSEMPLEKMCAQEILAAFMWVIAGVVGSITGRTSPRGEPGDHESNLDDWFHFKRDNAFFQGLTEAILPTGIANEQEAYAIFIPPFETNLPGISYIIAETHRKVKKLQATERAEDMEKAKDALLRLFEICQNHPTPTAVTATALLTEQLFALQSQVALWGTRPSFDSEVEKATECINSITEALASQAENPTMAALSYLYEKQGRVTTGSVFPDPDRDRLEEVRERANWSTAHRLAYRGEPEGIANMPLEEDPISDINSTDILGWTPLHYASNKSHDHTPDCVSSIITRGGSVEARSMLDDTPLHLAASRGNGGVVAKLLENNRNTEFLNIDQRTPIHLAARKGHKAVVDLLISKGANFEARDKFGWTPLHFAAFEGKLEVAKLLFGNGARADARDNKEMTPLHLAAYSDRVDIVRWLLSPRISAYHSPEDATGRRPLDLAAERGSYAAAHNLCLAGVDVNKPDKRNIVPLYLAVRGGGGHCTPPCLHRGVVELLFERGAHYAHFEDLLALARDRGHMEVLEVLPTYRPA